MTEIYHNGCPLPAGATADDLLDDGTWQDLDLDRVVEQLDRTITVPGRCVLERMLRHPIGGTPELEARRRAVESLNRNVARRDQLEQALKLARRRGFAEQDLLQLVWGPTPEPERWAWRYSAMAGFAVVAAVLAAFTLSLGWFVAAFAAVVTNAAVHARVVGRSEGRLTGMRQLRRMLLCARRLEKIEGENLEPARGPLRAALSRTRGIERRLGLMLHNSPLGSNDLAELFLDYVNQLLLLEVQLYAGLLPRLREQREAVQEVFQAVGTYDAWQSQAAHCRETADWCEAVWVDEGAGLDIGAAQHPLLPEAVPNSLALATPGVVVTGSNMSGKTTFLRTVAVNSLLAQTTGRCRAAHYRGRRMRIISLLDQSDDLNTGTSYYLAAAERMRTLVRLSEGPELLLGLVDEPLDGTNSAERFAASQAILRYVAERRGRVLVTTHDLELAQLLETRAGFASFHFSDYADATGMHFDYTMHSGLAYHANAIAVLVMLGFPKAITDAATAAATAGASAAG